MLSRSLGPLFVLLLSLSGCGVGLCINEQNCSSLSVTPSTFVSLSAVELTAKKVTLSWTPWTGSGNRYSVYYSTTPNLSSVAEILLNGTPAGETTDASFTITDFTFDKDYYFNVIATDGNKAQLAYTLRSPYCGGTGTASDPYQVCDPGSLQLIELHLSSSYLVTSDIDLSGTTAWNSGDGFKSIGLLSGNRFTGSMDGGDHTLHSLFSKNSYGLFYILDQVTLSNLRISDAKVEGFTYSGILAGLAGNGSMIQNVHTSGAITGFGSLGGLIGQLGFTSSLASNVDSCSSSATVRSTTGSRVGGLIGETEAGDGSNIRKSFASGNVIATNLYSGGLLGYATGTGVIEDCYATGNLYSTLGLAGGLVGGLNSSRTIRRSYATGNVFTTSTFGGGLIGSNGGTTENSFAVGNVSASGSLGGFSGNSTGLSNVHWFNHPFNPATCYSVGDVNCTSHTNPTWFYDIANYDGGALELDWDFSSTGAWIMPATGKYPVLRWQNPNRPIEFPPEFRNGRKIGYSDMAAYRVWGFCSTPGATISFSGPNAPANTSCNGGTFEVSWDFSGQSDGTVQIAVQEGTATPVTRALSKDTANCNAVTNAEIDTTPGGTIDVRFASSSGPHFVCNVQQLSRLQAVTGNWSKSFVLGNNIDLSAGYTNAVIGTAGTPFTGSFAGEGFVLQGLSMSSASGNYGFFGRLDGLVSDLGLERASVVTTGGSAGILAGNAQANAQVENVYTTGYLRGASIVGGLVGDFNGTLVEDSFSTADVVASSTGAGGLLGWFNPIPGAYSMTRVFATGDVRGLSDVGGLAGRLRKNASHCFATGTVQGRYDGTGIGGVIGQMDNSTGSLENCYATGPVYGGTNVGGLIGDSSIGAISKVYASGSVLGLTNSGGLVGYKAGGYSLSDGFFSANIWGLVDVGPIGGQFTNSGITTSNLYWIGQADDLVCVANTNGASVNCQVVTSRQPFLEPSEVYENWDFTSHWKFPTAGGLPILQWQEEAP